MRTSATETARIWCLATSRTTLCRHGPAQVPVPESPGDELIGYADRLSVAPGESIRFMISTERLEDRSALVRLIHGDTNPNGPGYKEELVPGALDGRHRGQRQMTLTGSYVLVEDG